MENNSTYYLGRVLKLNMSNDNFFNAISSSSIIETRKYLWTFINYQPFKQNGKVKYIYAELAKYLPSGEVSQVDEQIHVKRNIEVERHLISSSPFVYIPEFSGIAFQHIWNKIERKTFVSIFSKIIIDRYDEFFVECEIEPIAEYLKFLLKLI